MTKMCENAKARAGRVWSNWFCSSRLLSFEEQKKLKTVELYLSMAVFSREVFRSLSE